MAQMSSYLNSATYTHLFLIPIWFIGPAFTYPARFGSSPTSLLKPSLCPLDKALGFDSHPPWLTPHGSHLCSGQVPKEGNGVILVL